jgi:hypothetical protein
MRTRLAMIWDRPASAQQTLVTRCRMGAQFS